MRYKLSRVVFVLVLVIFLWIILKRSVKESNIRRQLGLHQFKNASEHVFMMDEKDHVRKVKCLLKKTFVYVKTHKTASTALYDVMYGYVTKHKLKKSMKVPRPFVGGYPGHVTPRFVYLRINGEAVRWNESLKRNDLVVMDHFRFDHVAVKQLVGKNAPIFTIIREPWSQFQSAFHFYHKPNHRRSLSETCFTFPFVAVTQGARVDVMDYLLLAETRLNSSVPWYFRSNNYQSHDLGLDPQLDNDDVIKEKLRELHKHLDLVMVAEYFDESLILLKELMCMDWMDLVYPELKDPHHYLAKDLSSAGPRAKQVFQKLHKLDIALYAAFNATLWKKVDKYGLSRMKRDVATLRELRRKNFQETVTLPKRKRRYLKPSFGNLKIKSADPNLSEQQLILFNKLRRSSKFLTTSDANDLSQYMVKNSGGCPT